MRCAKLAGLRQRFLVGNGWPSSGENDYLYSNTAKRHCDDVLRVGVAFDIVSLVRDDDDVYYNIRWRLKLEVETERGGDDDVDLCGGKRMMMMMFITIFAGD